MEYARLGNTGLEVSKICLGCMSFGDPGKWSMPWVLKEDQSRPIIKAALEKGINFFDTANCYSNGVSEEVTGRALKDFADRDKIVLATKVNQRMFDGPNGAGNSRKAILCEIDNSLRRLQTDYVDLYIIHRWDYFTPIEETMEALNDVVRAGKARYIGASAMFAWQFEKARNVAEKHGWANFVSMQNHLNLIYREEEREMLPYCEDAKIAVTPYSPLAAGRLTKSWEITSERYKTDPTLAAKYGAAASLDRPIVERVEELAKKRGISMVHVALAWVMQKSCVASSIVGVSGIANLDGIIASLDVKLTEEEVIYLEEPYKPHKVIGAYEK